MPPLTRWSIKLSLVYFVAALALGVLLAAQPALDLPETLAYALTPAYFHLFLVGWVTMLIFGVVYWMFPKYTMEKPRGLPWLAGVSLALLNLGLLLRVVAEPLNASQPGRAWGWWLAASAVIQFLGGLAFVLNTFGRVKEK